MDRDSPDGCAADESIALLQHDHEEGGCIRASDSNHPGNHKLMQSLAMTDLPKEMDNTHSSHNHLVHLRHWRYRPSLEGHLHRPSHACLQHSNLLFLPLASAVEQIYAVLE